MPSKAFGSPEITSRAGLGARGLNIDLLVTPAEEGTAADRPAWSHHGDRIECVRGVRPKLGRRRRLAVIRSGLSILPRSVRGPE